MMSSCARMPSLLNSLIALWRFFDSCGFWLQDEDEGRLRGAPQSYQSPLVFVLGILNRGRWADAGLATTFFRFFNRTAPFGR